MITLPRTSEPDAGDERFAAALPDAFAIAVDEFPAPSADLVTRGVVRGRQMRRNRALAVVAAAVAGVVVVSGGAWLAAAGTGRGNAAHDVPPGVPSVAPVSTADGPPVTSDFMVATLKSLLPKDGTTSVITADGSLSDGIRPSGSPTGLPRPPGVEVMFHSAAGTSEVGVFVTQAQESLKVCMPVEYRPWDVCSATPVDGGTLVVDKGFEYSDSNKGQRMWAARMVYDDGTMVEVDAWGGGGEKGTSSSVDPVLSAAQLSAVAQSSAWAPARASLVPAKPQPKQVKGEPSGDRMRVVLLSLLPGGLRVTDEVDGTGSVTLVTDDGLGKSEVSVSAWTVGAQPTTCDGQELVCSDGVLEDGTKYMSYERTSEKGTSSVVWEVDTLAPNGRRVTALAVNSESEAAEPTRGTPLLTLDQLMAIATSPEWWAGTASPGS